jgi:hypothetical protein
MIDWLFDLIDDVLDWFDSDDEYIVAELERRPPITNSLSSRYLLNRPTNLPTNNDRPYRIGSFAPQPPKKPLVPGPFHPLNPQWRNNPANPNNFNSPWNPNNPNSPRNIHNRHNNMHGRHNMHGRR